MTRWTFTDPVAGDTHIFERNPREMTTPYLPQETTAMAQTADGLTRAHRVSRKPSAWSFTGDIRTQAHHDALLDWSKRPNRIHVADHLGRTFEILPVGLDVQEQRPNKHTDWRFTYTFKTLMYGEIT